MDGDVPIPLDITNITNLTPSFTQEYIHKVDSDHIDWVSLLSAPASNFSIHDYQKPSSDQRDHDESQIGVKNIGKFKRARKVSPQRIAFHTRSDDEILDDGFRWRKYGQKAVKNSRHPRSYYRCTRHTCNVKKQIQRLSNDSSIVVTTYEGIHNHPCEKLMETLAPLLKQLQFLARI